MKKTKKELFRIRYMDGMELYTEMSSQQALRFPLKNVVSIQNIKYVFVDDRQLLTPYDVCKDKAIYTPDMTDVCPAVKRFYNKNQKKKL